MNKQVVLGVGVLIVVIIAVVVFKKTEKPKVAETTKAQTEASGVKEEVPAKPGVVVPPIPEGEQYVLVSDPSMDGLYVKKNEVRIYGRTGASSATVTLNDTPLLVKDDGVLDELLTLTPGENRFSFVYEDMALGVRYEKKWLWVFDQAAPVFQITSPPSVSFIPSNKPAIEVTGEFMLGDEGKIEEGVKVSAGETQLTVSEDRRSFSGTIELPDGEHEITVTAVDPAGNEATQKVPVTVDTKAPEMSELKQEFISKEGNVPMVRLSGKVSEKCELNFGKRFVPVADDLTFQVDMLPFDVEAAVKNDSAEFVAKDAAGNVGEAKITRTDFSPPYWIELAMYERNDNGAILQGKVSESKVKVVIGGIEATSDDEGNVTLNGVQVTADKSLIDTTLTDAAGNVTQSQQWFKVVEPE